VIAISGGGIQYLVHDRLLEERKTTKMNSANNSSALTSFICKILLPTHFELTRKYTNGLKSRDPEFRNVEGFESNPTMTFRGRLDSWRLGRTPVTILSEGRSPGYLYWGPTTQSSLNAQRSQEFESPCDAWRLSRSCRCSEHQAKTSDMIFDKTNQAYPNSSLPTIPGVGGCPLPVPRVLNFIIKPSWLLPIIDDRTLQLRVALIRFNAILLAQPALLEPTPRR
jgi:hypothetical protein